MSRYIKGLAGDGEILVILSDSTEAVKKASEIHDTISVSTAAFGRTLTGASMMGLLLKNDDSNVSIQVHGSSMIKKIFGYSDNQGNVKGYISHPDVELPLNNLGKLDVGGAVGKHGKMIVIKDYGFGNPYVGQSDLTTGEIAEDIVYYYMFSEQQPSMVSLGVYMDKMNVVKAAGGIMIQTMPNISEEMITKLEETLKDIRPISSMLNEGLTLESIFEEIMKDIPHKVIDEGQFTYQCDCSHEKVTKALISVGRAELKNILDEDGHSELSCHFCNKKYHYDRKDLLKLIHELEDEANKA